jgi:hypothetical protein
MASMAKKSMGSTSPRSAGYEILKAFERRIPGVLYRWHDITGSYSEQKEWARRVTEDEEGLKKFLQKFSFISTTTNMEKTTTQIKFKANDIAEFLDIDVTAGRVEKILSCGLPDGEMKQALEAFISSYTALKKTTTRRAI